MSEIDENTVPLVAVTAAVGAIVLLFILLCGIGKKTKADEEESSEDSSKESQQSNGKAQPTQKKNKERITSKRKDTKPSFTHPWLVGSLKNHSSPVLGIDFSPNGKYLASWSEDRCVLIWYTKQFNQKEHKSVRANVELDHCTKLKFSPDGKAFIGSLYRQNTIRAFKIGKKDDGSIGNIQGAFDFSEKYEKEISHIGLSVSGKFIMTGYGDTTVKIWDLKGELLSTINTNNMGNSYVAVSPCGRFVAASGFTPDVKVWEVVFDKGGTFKEVSRAFELKGHTSGVYSFSFSAGSTRMATVSKDGTWKLWNTDIEYQKRQDPGLLTTGSYDNADVPARIALSPDGRVVAIAQGCDITVYNALNGDLEQTFTDVHSLPISGLEYDLSGKYLVSSGDKHIHVLHNVPGYKVTIQDLEAQAQKTHSNALKQRLQDQIKEAKAAYKPFQ